MHHILLFQDSPQQWVKPQVYSAGQFREYDPIEEVNTYKICMGFIVIYNMFKYPQ